MRKSERKPEGMCETWVGETTAGGMNGNVFIRLATAFLFAGSAGFAQAAVPERAECAFPESAGPQLSVAAPQERNIHVASQLAKVSTPQVHVNTAHVNAGHVPTGSVHPPIGVTSNAVKIRGANSQSLKVTHVHPFDKNNDGKGYFLKLDGIEGESQDTRKGQHIEIDSFGR